MKRRNIIIVLSAALLLALFIWNINPVRLLNDQHINKIVISDVFDPSFNVTITDENEIRQLIEYFKNYNLKNHRHEAIDSIMQYKVLFYENEKLIVFIELNLLGKDSDWAYNVARIYQVDKHVYYKIPEGFIERISSLLNSH